MLFSFAIPSKRREVLGGLFVLLLFLGFSCAKKDEKTPTPKPEKKAFPKKWVSAPKRLDISSSSKYPYARVIIHLHSTYSHDACDGKPQENGKKNMPCLMRLREALCYDSIDAAFLTEHSTWMGKGDAIEDMMLYQKGDQKVMEQGKMIANIMKCKDGHQVVLTVGAENALMPVGFKGHPKVLSGKSLSQTYSADGTEAIGNFEKAGATVLIAHGESKKLDYLKKHAIHGMEVYNLHAMLDPRIRKNFLKISAEQGIAAFLPYINEPDTMPHPDLAFLGFHQAQKVTLDKWNALLASKMIYGYGGTDAHENVLKNPLKDGERPDSYKRMMRWFSNHFMVKEKTLKAYREALSKGRSQVVFETLGTPDTFAFYAETKDGKRIEQGSTTSLDIAHIKVKALHPYKNGEEAVNAEIQLIFIDASGAKVVAKGQNELEFKSPKPGVYRVEVHIIPIHLKPLLTEATQDYIRSYPWIYSNPIRIQK